MTDEVNSVNLTNTIEAFKKELSTVLNMAPITDSSLRLDQVCRDDFELGAAWHIFNRVTYILIPIDEYKKLTSASISQFVETALSFPTEHAVAERMRMEALLAKTLPEIKEITRNKVAEECFVTVMEVYDDRRLSDLTERLFDLDGLVVMIEEELDIELHSYSIDTLTPYTFGEFFDKVLTPLIIARKAILPKKDDDNGLKRN